MLEGEEIAQWYKRENVTFLSSSILKAWSHSLLCLHHPPVWEPANRQEEDSWVFGNPKSTAEEDWQDSKMVGQELNLYTKTWSAKDIKVQNFQNRRVPGGRRVPPREENPRMKCRNCGAFGHTVRSKKCPIKSWDGAMAPLPLGTVKKEKENQDPGKRQNPQSPEPVKETEEEKKERERLEQQRKALLLKFPKKPPERKPRSWKDTTHPGDYLRRPSRPSFFHVNKKLSLNRTQTNLPSVKKSDGEHASHTAPSTEDPNITLPLEEDKCQALEVPNMPKTTVGHSDEEPTFSEKPADQSTEYCLHQVPQAAFKVQEMNPVLNTQSPAQHSDEDKHSRTAHTDSQRAELSFKVTHKRNLQLPTQIIQNPPKKRRVSSYQRPQKNTEKPMLESFRVVPRSSTSQVEPKGLPQVTGVEQQPPHNRALLNFTQPFTESSHPLSSHVPVQPLRMVFTRLRNGYWSSRIFEASSSHPPEKKMSSDKISPSLKPSEEPYPWVPLRLFINTRLTSSFEESHWEEGHIKRDSVSSLRATCRLGLLDGGESRGSWLSHLIGVLGIVEHMNWWNTINWAADTDTIRIT